MGTHRSIRNTGHMGSTLLCYPGHTPSDHRHRMEHKDAIPVNTLLPTTSNPSKRPLFAGITVFRYLEAS